MHPIFIFALMGLGFWGSVILWCIGHIDGMQVFWSWVVGGGGGLLLVWFQYQIDRNRHDEYDYDDHDHED